LAFLGSKKEKEKEKTPIEKTQVSCYSSMASLLSVPLTAPLQHKVILSFHRLKVSHQFFHLGFVFGVKVLAGNFSSLISESNWSSGFDNNEKEKFQIVASLPFAVES
jgi:zinc transporter ZupT